MIKKVLTITLLLGLFSSPTFAQVYFTTGLKIGELTDSSVVILARLNSQKASNPITHERKAAPMRHPINFDEKAAVSSLDGAVSGQKGWGRIILKSEYTIFKSKWSPANKANDFIIKRLFDNLSPDTKYEIVIEGKKSRLGKVSRTHGNFKTPISQKAPTRLTFTSSSCQYFWDFDDKRRGFKAYDAMSKIQPAFHCQTGDYVYYDKPGPLAKNIEQARHKWAAMNSWPSLVDFYNKTPIYIQKDDHDILDDDANPFSENYGDLSFADGLAVWYEQNPILAQPVRSFRWGADLELWFVEGREYRSDNKMPDGEAKTIWGERQKAWIIESMTNSDATFKILVSPTPVIGPDRAKGKNDNHSNKAFETEGKWLRGFLSNQKNTFVICGDRHWQYVSKDQENGLMEFSSGATSDEHAQGWNPEDIMPEHQFLRVEGGFLSVQVEESKSITFRHHDVNGVIVNEVVIKN